MSRADDQDEIELEPTQVFLRAEAPGAAASPPAGSLAGSTAGAPSFHVALVEGAGPSISGEMERLLRSRLRAAAVFIGLAAVVMLTFGLLTAGSTISSSLPFVGVRVALSLVVIALMSSQVPLSLKQLRWIEYAYFGLLTVTLMAAQYLVNRAFIQADDLPRLIANEKNSILALFAMMMLYGVFIPNDPRVTARVVMTMALGPMIMLSLILERYVLESPLAGKIVEMHLAESNAVYIAIAAALAIYTAYVLHGMRREIREAKRLGQYQLGEKLGAGGMGEVYLAEHQLLKRPCALKLIRPDVHTDPLARARFEREVKSAAMLSHPNTIAIFDYGHTDDGTFYYVMEYLPGLSLESLVREFGPLSPGRAVYLARQVCGALGEAHRLGLVHRDLKPANVFVSILGGQCDVAKVLDYGLVKLTANPQAEVLTSDYTVSGTPQYMSPEQARAENEIDGRSDIYALGAVLYYMLAGRPPFDGKNAMALMISHARDIPRPPSETSPGIPADLDAIVLRCLEKDPKRRFASMRELAEALGASTAAESWSEAQAEQWWAEQAWTRSAEGEDGAAGNGSPAVGAGGSPSPAGAAS